MKERAVSSMSMRTGADEPPFRFSGGAHARNRLHRGLNAIADMLTHGVVCGLWIAACQRLGQLPVETRRLHVFPRREIVKPVEHEHIIALDHLPQLHATGVFGNAHVKLEVMVVY